MEVSRQMGRGINLHDPYMMHPILHFALGVACSVWVQSVPAQSTNDSTSTSRTVVNDMLLRPQRSTLITYPPFQTRVVTYDEQSCSIIGANKKGEPKWTIDLLAHGCDLKKFDALIAPDGRPFAIKGYDILIRSDLSVLLLKSKNGQLTRITQEMLDNGLRDLH